MCVFSNCCGCQTLQQGLFIFAVLDILIRWWMLTLKKKSTLFLKIFYDRSGCVVWCRNPWSRWSSFSSRHWPFCWIQDGGDIFRLVFVETNKELPLDQIVDPDLDDCLRIPHPDIGFCTTNSHHIWLGFRWIFQKGNSRVKLLCDHSGLHCQYSKFWVSKYKWNNS